MTEAELMQFLFWMEYHQPTADQVAIESLQYDIGGIMETVRVVFKRLQSERDEARREVCEHRVKQQHSPQQHAIDRGWDCFKNEETQ